jgi:hypothetical protein
VTSQYGAHLINVYAFGAFPEGYELAESQIADLPTIESEEDATAAEGEVPAVDAENANPHSQTRPADTPGSEPNGQ